jgi:DNA-directed RNA polymerase subunit RPC12/RpoP
MLGYVVGGVIAGVLLLWYGVAKAWSSSVALHQPELHEGSQRLRFGWCCPRCAHTTAPACKVVQCGGPLVWVQQGTRIKCVRCHRYFIAHPMLFRQTPRPRHVRCRRCGWIGVIKDWKVS